MQTETIQIPVEILDQATQKVDQINAKLSGAGDSLDDLKAQFADAMAGVGKVPEKLGTDQLAGQIDDAGASMLGFGTIAGGIVAAVGVGVGFIVNQMDEIVKLSEERPELFSAEELRNVQAYSEQVEELKDQWTEAKIELVSGVAPALTNILERSNAVSDAMELAANQGENWAFISEQQKQAFIDQVLAIEETTDAYSIHKDTMQEVSDKYDEAKNKIDNAKDALKLQNEIIKETTEINREYLDGLGNISGEHEKYTEEQINLRDQMVEVEDEINSLIEQGWNPLGEKVGELRDKWQELDDKIYESTEEYALNSKRRILAMTEEQLAADGLTEEEVRALEEKGIQWGIYTQTAVDQMRYERDEIAKLVANINSIPSEKNVTIKVQQIGGYEIGTEQYNRIAYAGRQHGGPVGQGTPYMVGERGPEMFVPSQSGSIVSNNQLGGGLTEAGIARAVTTALVKAGIVQ